MQTKTYTLTLGKSFDYCSMEHLCTEAVKKSLDAMKNGLYRVIPQNLISVFEPYEI